MPNSENRPSQPTSIARIANLGGALVNKSSLVRLEWIDVLRGIAILMVILIHVGTHSHVQEKSIKSFTDYGSRGVQLFFVVSAFILFRHVCKKFNPKSFYTTRYARIAPMFFLALIFYAIVGLPGSRMDMWNLGGYSTYL